MEDKIRKIGAGLMIVNWSRFWTLSLARMADKIRKMGTGLMTVDRLQS